MTDWKVKAEDNIDKWGIQSMKDICLAMQEELGELTQAVLQYHHEEGDINRITEELSDLAPLCYQMIYSILQEEQNIRFQGKKDKEAGQ